MPARCNYEKDDGERCRSEIGIDKSGRCFTHSELPHRVTQRKEARRRGGHTTNQRRTVLPSDAPDAPQTLEDVADWLRWVTVAVTTGVIDGRTAREATMALKELRPTLDRLETGAKVEELRRQIDELGGGGG